MNQPLFLLLQWLRRDIESRYRGAMLGLFWPVAQPLLQIAIFTLVFHRFMQLRWPAAGGTGDALDYALNLFAGLAVFNFFSEVLGRAPAAVLSQPSLVTKVRFPLGVLPVVTVGAAMVHLLVGALLVCGAMLGLRQIAWTALLLPVSFIPMILYALGFAWSLAALGVYLRDIAQVMPSAISLLMFLTPVLYPSSLVPEALRGLVDWNPIGWGVGVFRALAIDGQLPGVGLSIAHVLASALVALAGRLLFRRLSRGFSDVL